MKILVIIPSFPYPLDSGGNQAFFNMLDGMRKEHQITLITRGWPESAALQRDLHALNSIWPDVDIHIAPYPDTKIVTPYPDFYFTALPFRFIRYIATSFRRKYNRYLLNHSSDDLSPEKIARRKTSLRAKNYFDEDIRFYEFVKEVACQGFDAIQCEFYDMLPLAYCLPKDTYKIFVCHEIRFVRCQNEIELFPDRNFEDEIEVQREKDLEISLMQHFDRIITLTQTDKNILSERIPADKITVSPAVVQWGEVLTFKSCRRDFVFVGSCSHYPNLDAMLWFCRNILPLLRKKMPVGFHVHVTGRWDDSIKEQLFHEHPELQFTGFIPSLPDFLNGKITIIPIRIGSGMRMKVTESIQAMSPIVSTSKGMEGQQFLHNQECMIADSAEDFAAAACKMASDENLQQKLAEKALLTAQSTYRPKDMVEKRLSIYRNINRH